jgi:hypothetical protein
MFCAIPMTRNRWQSSRRCTTLGVVDYAKLTSASRDQHLLMGFTEGTSAESRHDDPIEADAVSIRCMDSQRLYQ